MWVITAGNGKVDRMSTARGWLGEIIADLLEITDNNPEPEGKE
jgi:hypothetical protein